MRISDGYWEVPQGWTLLRAVQTRDLVVESGGAALTAYVATAPIRSRGDTLNRALLTVRLRSPMPGVIGVRVSRHEGGVASTPDFALLSDGEHGSARVDGEEGVLESGGLRARVSRGSYALSFEADGRRLSGSVARGTGVALAPDDSTYAFERLELGVGHLVYGLGERFGPVVKNGQSVSIWNNDGGTASEQAYKNVPFFLTNAGYGVFVRHPEEVSFEVGSEAVSATQVSVPGEVLEYYVIHGPTPKEILARYTALTGRAPAVPPWSFGLWLSTSFTTSYDEATVTGFVDGMAQRGIPLSVFHFDCFWMREFHWCDFVWDPETFPDPGGMIARLHDRGLRVCVWVNPYIAQRSHLFAEGRARGYLVRRPDGSVWQWDKWQAGMALVDFTNPDAARWYTDQLGVLLDQGVDCFKTDFGERIPTDVVWHDGSDPRRMHNYYSLLYNRAVFDLLRAHRGEGEAVLFARSATAGGQQYPVHWGGDCESTFPSMAETLRGGLSLAYSGFGYWSHDIGGFEGRPDAAVFKRWLPFGLLSSHSRLHGSDSYRVPWAYDEEAVDIARRFTRLKLALMPYLVRVAADVPRTGVGMMRPMLVEFPDDSAVPHLDRQFMLGESLLVAPVFSAEGKASYYLPDGPWTSLLGGAVVRGPRWVREVHEPGTLGLYARPGAVLPLGAVTDSPEYEWADGVTLAVFGPYGEERTVTVPGAGDGPSTTWSVSVHDEVLRVVRTDGPDRPWRVLLPGAGDDTAAADAPYDLPGRLVEASGDRVEVRVP